MDKHLIVGLGNPGSGYELTRHNMGFWAVDELAKSWSLSWRTKEQAQIAQQNRIFLLKPLTFMNNSGFAVASLIRREGISPGKLLVIYDDLDLPPGRIRLRPRGSSGGHRGLASIISCLGTEEFPRLRIGIGRPAPGVMLPRDWVLAPIQRDDVPALRDGIIRAAEAAQAWLDQGMEQAMTQFNRWDKED